MSKELHVGLIWSHDEICITIGDAYIPLTWEEEIESIKDYVEDCVTASARDRTEATDMVRKLTARLRDFADTLDVMLEDVLEGCEK